MPSQPTLALHIVLPFYVDALLTVWLATIPSVVTVFSSFQVGSWVILTPHPEQMCTLSALPNVFGLHCSERKGEDEKLKGIFDNDLEKT